MKKSTKKLSLNRETVRELDNGTLDQAKGGYISYTPMFTLVLCTTTF